MRNMWMLPDTGNLRMSCKTGIATVNLKFTEEGRSYPKIDGPRFLALPSVLP